MSQNTTSSTSHPNCPNCHCTDIIVIRLQCHYHARNTTTTQDNQRVIPVEQIISYPPTIQQNSYSYNPITHPAINHPATSSYPPQAISSAQYGNYGNFLNHNQEQQHMLEYNPGYGFAPHDISSPVTNNVTTFSNNTNPGFVQESSSGIHAQYTNVSGANQFIDIGAEINYGERPSLYYLSC
ncbi:hypothetical protein PNOK_0022200 [Pyrrhoderma noxium]|uniref:Uncharacterized protein n=1 Tax=Pyrrhoderma noxium TaxID=2282107 RepID=A0A286UUB1_9AGAM|nr:hypothetical protein PNOK_0022200 [Pyrrhoderma noxium]